MEDDEPDYDPSNPVRKTLGEDLKEPYIKKFQRFLNRGKTQDYGGFFLFLREQLLLIHAGYYTVAKGYLCSNGKNISVFLPMENRKSISSR